MTNWTGKMTRKWPIGRANTPIGRANTPIGWANTPIGWARKVTQLDGLGKWPNWMGSEKDPIGWAGKDTNWMGWLGHPIGWAGWTHRRAGWTVGGTGTRDDAYTGVLWVYTCPCPGTLRPVPPCSPVPLSIIATLTTDKNVLTRLDYELRLE